MICCDAKPLLHSCMLCHLQVARILNPEESLLAGPSGLGSRSVDEQVPARPFSGVRS